MENRDLFPPGSLPTHPAQLAALAVRIYRLFSKTSVEMNGGASAAPDAVIVQAIMAALKG
jgi:hypothetical protein